MFDSRSLLPIVASLALAASGCQRDAPASATTPTSSKSLSDQSPAATATWHWNMDSDAGNKSPSAPTPAPAQVSEPAGLGDSQDRVAETNAGETAGENTRPLPAIPADGRAIPITFDDLQLEMKEDAVFKPSLLTPRVKQLDGQRVRIRGFIFPAVFQQTGITRFPLVKNTQCKFGPGGLAHHVILVDLQPGLSTSFTVRPIAVEGRLTVRPFDGPDGKAWAVYHLAGEKVN